MSMLGQRSFMQRLSNKLIDFFMKKEIVGMDKLGNEYLRWTEKDRGERREVRWMDPHFTYDPNDISPEWRMWLKKQRDAPPTPEEILAGENRRAAMAAKVAAIEERERMRRARQEAAGATSYSAGPDPDLQQFIETMKGEQQTK